MKNILFSVSDPHSTPFTMGIEPVHQTEKYNFIQVPYDQFATQIHIHEGLCGMPANGLLLNGPQAQLNHYRYNKNSYGAMFNAAAAATGVKDFQSVVSYRNSFAVPEGETGTIWLRPSLGARGMGFIEFPYPNTTVNAVDTLVAKWCKEEFDDEYFEKTLKKIGGKISASPNVKLAEVKACLKSGFDFVKVIPNVAEEYRIITDHLGHPTIVVKRNLNDYGLSVKQASGGYQNIDTNVGVKFLEGTAIGKQVIKLIKHLALPIHSFDLFITDDKKFGFFEACSQFGCTSVPDGFVRKETYKLLDLIADQLK